MDKCCCCTYYTGDCICLIDGQEHEPCEIHENCELILSYKKQES